MDYNSFLGEKRWEILKIIVGGDASPIKISEKLRTTVSYVSQQLKLLEVAGLVSKVRTGLAEKGKPRNIYSVNKEFMDFTLLEKGFAVKKQLSVDYHKKAILKIWSIDDESYHIPIEKFFLGLEKDLGKIKGIFIQQSPKLKAFVITGSKEVENKANRILTSLGKELEVVFLAESDSVLFSEEYIPLYVSDEIKEGVNQY